MGAWRNIPAKLTLTTRFYLAAGVMIALMATAFAWFGTRYVTEQTLLNAAKQAAAQAEELQAEYGGNLDSQAGTGFSNGGVITTSWPPRSGARTALSNTPRNQSWRGDAFPSKTISKKRWGAN